MYGIVEISGHQYKVQAGDVIDVQKLTAEAGTDLNIDQVLLIGGGSTVIGKPVIAGASVTARVIKHDRSRKVVILRRAPGKYIKKNGHRQHYSSLLITEVNDGNGNTAKIDAKSKYAEKFLK
jgi:large subunit ribosomal protein L21